MVFVFRNDGDGVLFDTEGAGKRGAKESKEGGRKGHGCWQGVWVDNSSIA